MIYSFTNFCYSQEKYNYLGAIKLQDSTFISYRVNFIEKSGKVTGYSITDLGGEHETRSNIFGEYDKNEAVLNFRETGIVYTKSIVSQNDFCFLNTTFKNFKFGKTEKAKANFVGLFSDNTKCIDGEILLNTVENAQERSAKITKKIIKSKRIPDSLKQKFKNINIMNALQLNMLKKDKTLSVFTKSKTIKLIIYDGGKEDHDEISIIINGKTLVDKFEPKKDEKVWTIDLISNKTEIVIKANNEGDIAPNTAVVVIDDGDNYIKALSNLKIYESTQIDVLKI